MISPIMMENFLSLVNFPATPSATQLMLDRDEQQRVAITLATPGGCVVMGLSDKQLRELASAITLHFATKEPT